MERSCLRKPNALALFVLVENSPKQDPVPALCKKEMMVHNGLRWFAMVRDASSDSTCTGAKALSPRLLHGPSKAIPKVLGQSKLGPWCPQAQALCVEGEKPAEGEAGPGVTLGDISGCEQRPAWLQQE